jgi:hypothetical protein
MKEDLWRSFALKHRYNSATRDDAARRERLRRVVDDIAYTLYGGKMATAARVSRPYVGQNRAWLSAEFIPPRRRATAAAAPADAAGWHTRVRAPSRRHAESPSPVRRTSPSPAPAPMGSQSDDEFFARHGVSATTRPSPSLGSRPQTRLPMDSQSNDEFFARHAR